MHSLAAAVLCLPNVVHAGFASLPGGLKLSLQCSPGGLIKQLQAVPWQSLPGLKVCAAALRLQVL